jgi:hypothetical protein
VTVPFPVIERFAVKEETEDLFLFSLQYRRQAGSFGHQVYLRQAHDYVFDAHGPEEVRVGQSDRSILLVVGQGTDLKMAACCKIWSLSELARSLFTATTSTPTSDYAAVA